MEFLAVLAFLNEMTFAKSNFAMLLITAANGLL